MPIGCRSAAGTLRTPLYSPSPPRAASSPLRVQDLPKASCALFGGPIVQRAEVSSLFRASIAHSHPRKTHKIKRALTDDRIHEMLLCASRSLRSHPLVQEIRPRHGKAADDHDESKVAASLRRLAIGSFPTRCVADDGYPMAGQTEFKLGIGG